jgi:CarD family transcriptional regulator
MNFSVGDKVMHPKVGAGQITGVEHRELVQGFEHYYVIKLLSQNSTLYTPISKMNDLGVRLVMSHNKFRRVVDTLRSTPSLLSKNFKQRQGRVREKIDTGLPIELAEVVRDLTYLKEHKRLTKVDQDLLSKGRELLATEMALATDTDVAEILETIDTALSVAVAEELEESQV